MITGATSSVAMPSESIFRRTLKRINGNALDKPLGGWSAIRAKGFHGLRPLANKEKWIRGAQVADDRCPHLLAAITHTDGVVLGQVNVDVKTNEIPMLPTPLDTIDLTRTVITTDARDCPEKPRQLGVPVTLLSGAVTTYGRALPRLCAYTALTAEEPRRGLPKIAEPGLQPKMTDAPS